MNNLTVIKIGGALLDDAESMTPFWEGVRRLKENAPVLIVHGGGPQATAMAQRLGRQPKFVCGRRITTALDLNIAQWTVRGELNTRLVSMAMQHDLRPVGLSGVDGGILRVSRRPPWMVDGEMIDFGWVGDVDDVAGDLLALLLEKGHTPIVAPLGIDEEGKIYNVNADTVAQVLAQALQATRLLLVTEAGCVKQNVSSSNGRIPVCSRKDFARGKKEGWIHGGMIVKLGVAFGALQAGVEEVFVLSPDDLASPSRATQIIL